MDEFTFFNKLPQQLRDNLIQKVRINKILQEINVLNIETSFLNLCSLGDISDKDFLNSISRSINTYLFIHSQSILLYSKIFNLIINKLDKDFTDTDNNLRINDIKKSFIDNTFRICQFSFINDQNHSCAYFIGLLIQNGHLSIECAHKFLKLINEPILSRNIATGLVYFLFGCCRRLNDEAPQLLNELFDILDSKITSFQIPAFYLLKELKDIRNQNFEPIRNFNFDTKLPILIHAIHFDDIDFVQNYFSNPKSDINMQYPISLFEPCQQNDSKEPFAIICAAALYGSLKCFKYLLLNGAEIGDCRPFAIDGGNIEIIRLVEQRTPFDINSLFQAVELHRYEAFTWLFESKGFVVVEEIPKKVNLSLNSTNDDTSKNDEIDKNECGGSCTNENLVLFKMPKAKSNRTLLHSAAMSNSIRCCIYILDHSLDDINVTNKFGFTPIMRAVMNGSIDVAQILMNSEGIDLSKRTEKSNNTLLHLAAMKDDVEIANIFLPFFDINSVNFSNQTSVFTASASKAIHCLRLFLKSPNIDLSIREKHSNLNCFLIAVSSRSLDCAIELFNTGLFDINDIQGKLSALSIAASNGDYEMMKFILSINNIDLKKDSLSLFYAIDSENADCVKILLDNNDVDINTLNRTKETPLLHACNLLDNKNTIEIIKLLVNHQGIKLNCRDKYGRTPLLVATAYKSIEIVSFLLQTPGVKINVKEKVFIKKKI